MSQAPSFTIIPDQKAIAEMQRDLRFHPATGEPKALTRDQITQFNRDGFLKGLRVFNQQETETTRRYFDDLLARVLAAGGDSYSISTAHLKHGRVYDLLTDPRLVAIVRDLIGDDVIAWGSHFFCK